jgi:urate oxidase
MQATLYKMAQLVIAQNKGVQTISYALPNKHYIPVNMNYIGVKNLSPSVNLFQMCRNCPAFALLHLISFFQKLHVVDPLQCCNTG